MEAAARASHDLSFGLSLGWVLRVEAGPLAAAHGTPRSPERSTCAPAPYLRASALRRSSGDVLRSLAPALEPLGAGDQLGRGEVQPGGQASEARVAGVALAGLDV